MRNQYLYSIKYTTSIAYQIAQIYKKQLTSLTVTGSSTLTCAGWIAVCVYLWKPKQKQVADDVCVQGGGSEGLVETGP
jgi:hypothetical protein